MLRRLRLAALAALLLACNDSTAPKTSAALDGVWDWTGHYASSNPGVVCNDTGSFAFTQKDSSFTGQSQHIDVCTGANGGPFHSWDSIKAGIVRGTAVTFSIFVPNGGGSLCSDTAVLTTSTGTLSGIASCGSATITFEAVRATAVTSVAVTPDTARTVVGGSLSFDTDLRTALGARVFLRDVTWTVDPASVGTLSALPIGAQLLATGGGTATVTATVATKSGSGTMIVAPPAGLSGVSAGDARTCAFAAGGAVSCWGAGYAGSAFGQVPVQLATALRFAAVSVGGEFACGLTSAGKAYCWGANESGQLGNGTTTDAATPVAVSGSSTFTSISAGYRYVCGLTTGGAALCWGENPKGQLGTANTTAVSIPTSVSGGVAFASISAKLNHTCGVSTSGTLFCWGDNSVGQLGDNTVTQRNIPTHVTGSQTYTAVSAGASGTCAVATGGVAYCWGTGVGGFYTNGTNQLTPVAVAGNHLFSAISLGDDHACGVTAAGVAWCWGANIWGQLGNGLKTSTATPVAVSGGLAFATISAGVYFYSDEGHSSHTCGVTTGGITYCWGDNLTYQLGNGTHPESAVPVKVAGQP